MTRWALASLGVVVGVAAWASLRTRSAPGEAPGAIETAFNDGIEMIEKTAVAEIFNFSRVANMTAVDRALVNHANVRAMMRVIRQGESSLDDSIGYRMICGKRGAAFSDFRDHPRPVLPAPCSRGAAGAYQITIKTWDWVRGLMRLPDFSPASQDAAALGLMAYRGALPAVLAGDLDAAFSKLRNEWTSLPGAAENNFTTFDGARRLFIASGGSVGSVA